MSTQPQQSNQASTSSTSSAPSAERPRITVIGYGEGEGRDHARRLRDRGHDVRVAMLSGGTSWLNAVDDGFRPTSVRGAAREADVIVLVVPPDEAEIVYWEEIAPLAPSGAMVVFADPVELDTARLPIGVDVAVITTSADGCSVSVVADATGFAHDRALSYLQALGGNMPRTSSSRFRIVDDNDPFPYPSRRVL